MPPGRYVGWLAAGAVRPGVFIALENGYFQEEGLAVDVVTFGLPPDILPALMTGQIQASGLSHTPGMFNALSREVNMRIVADKGQVTEATAGRH